MTSSVALLSFPPSSKLNTGTRFIAGKPHHWRESEHGNLVLIPGLDPSDTIPN